MKKLIVFLAPIFLLTCVFAQENDYFIHQSKVFKIIPPSGYSTTIPSENGVQFVNPQDKSFLLITFTNLKDLRSDQELLARFNDNEFRNSFIKAFENSLSSLKTQVTANRPRSVNGMPAWEFTTKGSAQDSNMKNKVIVLYKNNKEFFIMFGCNVNVFDTNANVFESIEQALTTFEVL